MIQSIVQYTNKRIQCVRRDFSEISSSLHSFTKDTDEIEIRAFLGLQYLRGLAGLNNHDIAHLYHPTMGPPSAVALQLRAPPKVSARAPAHRSYHFRGVKLKSCIKKIHHNMYISKQANVRVKHADTEGSSHKKFGTDARVQ